MIEPQYKRCMYEGRSKSSRPDPPVLLGQFQHCKYLTAHQQN